MHQGKAIIFSAPSGSGKTTIVKFLLSKISELEFSISATSRSPREGEENGKDYHFLSPLEFDESIENNHFVEWEEVYKGTKYGTLKSEVERIWSKGHHVIFDVDVVGGANLKKYFGDRALSIFVKVPDIDTLRTRLADRGTETPETLSKRVEKAEYEMTFESKFDETVVNKNLELAFAEANQLVSEFINS